MSEHVEVKYLQGVFPNRIHNTYVGISPLDGSPNMLIVEFRKNTSLQLAELEKVLKEVNGQSMEITHIDNRLAALIFIGEKR